MKMDLCKVCGKPSMVMSGDYGKKVPFKKAKDAESFTCGICIAYGRVNLKPKQPDQKHFDLKEWRKSKGLTQAALAETLQVDRSMIAKVETGEKMIPGSWEALLAKM
jgi:DNA-binding XRE family transcriptional regulator